MARLRPPGGRAASARLAEVPDEETTDVLAQDQGDNNTEGGPPAEEDASVAFQKQIEALKRSEQAAKDRAEKANREREEAINRAKAREAEVVQLRKTTAESNFEAVSSALAAAQAASMAATNEFAQASEAGDHQAAATAQRKLARAEAEIITLENGKAELQERMKAPPSPPEPDKTSVQADPLASFPPKAQAYLRSHPQYLNDPVLNAKINYHHQQLIKEGYEAYSDDYIDRISEMMDPKEVVTTKDDDDGGNPPTGRASVSAPVSREAPTSSGTTRDGRITLTALQKEAAKIAGITEVEYAKNLQRLRAEKANGNYTGGQ